MAKTKITNVTGAPATIPLPYGRLLIAGAAGIINDTPTNVLAALGGAAAIRGTFAIDEAKDADTTTITPMAAADIPDGAIGTAELADGAIANSAAGRAKIANNALRKAQTSQFVSAELTGNGGAQSTAHGLGEVPAQVYIALTAGPGAYTQPSIVEGAHDGTNVIVTVTTNWKYRIWAWL